MLKGRERRRMRRPAREHSIEQQLCVLGGGPRLEIVRYLGAREMDVTSIIEALELAQGTISAALGVLYEHGIVDCRPAGQKRYYRLSQDVRVVVLDNNDIEVHVPCAANEVIVVRCKRLSGLSEN